MQPFQRGPTLVLGTIPGWAAEASKVRDAVARHQPEAILLGIPPDDLAGLALLAEAEDPGALIGAPEPPAPKRRRDRILEPAGGTPGLERLMHPRSGAERAAAVPDDLFAGLDAQDARLLELLSELGPVRLPPPDLITAFGLAKEHAIPLEAIDIDDADHAELFTQKVGFAGLLRRQRADRRVLEAVFDQTDPYELVAAYDARRNQGPLAKVEAAREAHMARAIIARQGRVVAIVPAARFPGIVRRLAETG